MWTISNSKDWNYLKENFDWVTRMEGVPQDPLHHAEGNVAIHTQMVLEALGALPGFQSLLPQEQEILWASALLHDVEKYSATILEADGSITAHGHARKGAMKTRQILYREISTPFLIREQIVGLVRHHGLPLWLLERPDPLKALIKASYEVNTEWLALLARADALGRYCQDQEDLLYRIDCFEEYCREHNCWGAAKFFHSSHARMYYLAKEESLVDYVPFDEPEAEVILLSGLPGAGKDTYLQKKKFVRDAFNFFG
ncbi:HD domain-containing protein [Desertivirga brevis]|uniref:HD domain-containing protein n=1 Tax=Desertivirga brevis TaxID=2810310 RepID=UPI001A9699A9|nr:HD domain-containing protein [Pedobacter sp. SYSU D00873]